MSNTNIGRSRNGSNGSNAPLTLSSMKTSSTAAEAAALLPNHSDQLAAELSAHLQSALASDTHYQQVNDAKLRGMSQQVGWDQFHGMVLTAHLQPVNLRNEPIDQLASGIARSQAIKRSREIAAAKSWMNADEQAAAEREADQQNREYMSSFNINPPTNAHEFSRDWKNIARTHADDPDMVMEQRYRYLLLIDPRTCTASVLKGGIPLEMIGDIIRCVHHTWATTQVHQDDKTTDPTQATGGGKVASDASQSSQPDTTPSTNDSASSSTSAITTAASSLSSSSSSALPSLPSPSDVYHFLCFFHALTTMPSFTLSIFSLKRDDKLAIKHLLDLSRQRLETEEWKKWMQLRKEALNNAQGTAPSNTSNSTSATPAHPAGAASSSSAYPMLLPGWSKIGATAVTSSTSSGQTGATPLRDDAPSGNSMTVTAAPVKPMPKAAPLDIDPTFIDQLAAKFKLQGL